MTIVARDDESVAHPTSLGDSRREEEDGGFSDEELAELALAADPDDALAPDAVALSLARSGGAGLPEWYMPAVAARIGAARRWQKLLIGVLVLALLGIEISGLCTVFGQLVVG